MDVAEDAQFVAGIFKVAEGREEIDGEIEGRGALKFAHVFLHEFDGITDVGCVGACATEQVGGAIDAGDGEAIAGEGDGMACGAAAEVEDAAGADAGEGDDLCDLFRGGGEAFHGEHVGIEVSPEILVIEPGHTSG